MKISDYSEVFVPLEPQDEIVDIKCGKSHNILLTKQGYVYGFGASTHNQLNWKNGIFYEAISFFNFLNRIWFGSLWTKKN